MGNVITVKKETKIGKLKKMIRTLEQHRRAINFKVSRITRELKITEGKLRKTITRSTTDGGRTRLSARMHDSSTQLAQEIVFKRSQAHDLNKILSKINSMHETVTRIYLCIHKRQILSKISVGIERIDIADMAREAQEDSDRLEHQLLFDNVTKVHNLDRSADMTIDAIQKVDGEQAPLLESGSSELDSVIKEFQDEHSASVEKTKVEQERRLQKIKEALSAQTSSVRG